MTENVCKNCNAPLDMTEAKNGVIACSFCGSVYTLPKDGQSDAVVRLISAGQTALDLCRFDDALTAFTKAIELDGSEPEAYWGRALARNRVQYLRDTVNNRLQPICHKVTDEKFTADPDCRKALNLATPEQRAAYEKKAEEIDYIRREFYAIEKSGLTYDCFICVKVTEEDGRHTEDSFAALKLYNALKKAGYKPFFSEEEMGTRSGADYEALILYALKSAGSLLIVCSDKRYLETKWVKNEYTRYAAMLTDEEKERGSMAIVYLGKPIEKLPGLKGKLQGVDYRQFDAMDRIRAFIDSHDAEKQRKKAEREAAEREARERKEAEEREKIRAAAEAERKAAEEAAKARAEAAEKRAAEMERRLKELEAAQNAPKNAPENVSKPAQTPAGKSPLSDFEIEDGVLVKYLGKGGDVIIPDGVTEIGDEAFKDCENLVFVRIPDGVTHIDGSAFERCRQLGRVRVPDSLKSIGDRAFVGCNSLTGFTIPAGVKKIGENAFYGCKKLILRADRKRPLFWPKGWDENFFDRSDNHVVWKK